MKIKKLTIQNIASVEDAVIDFAGDVLGSEPLFLITGETGSGKTTILNAICLALYNTAPNIEGVQSAKSAARIGGMSIDDPRQLMRQGTFDARVELVFDGNDGYEYVASWVAHRATNGNPQNTKISLSCQHKQILLQGKREVAAAIESPGVVGLTYEQFCRTTMLAQGQFSKFMTSEDKDKSDILEKLTGTELYARIGQKVNERYKSVSDELAAITNRIAGAKLMTTEEREVLAETIKQLTQSIEDQQKALKVVNGKYDWLKSAEEMQKSRNANIELLGTLKAKLDDEQIKAYGATVSLWDKTDDIRKTLKNIKENTLQLMDSENQLADRQTEFELFVAGLEFVKGELSVVKAEIDNLYAQRKAEEEHAEMYANIQRIETLIDTILSKRESVSTLDNSIAAANKEKQEKTEPLADADAAVKVAEEELALACKKVEEKTNAAKNVNIKVLREIANDFEKDGKLVDECIETMSNLHTKMEEKRAADDVLEELKRQRTTATKQKEEQETLLPEAKKVAEALANQLKGKMDLRDHLADLQARFHDTHTCPLCGSAVSGIHSEIVLDEEVAKAKKAAEEAERSKNDIEKEINKAETILQTTKKPLDSAIKAAEAAARNEDEAKQSANRLLGKFQFKWDDTGINEQLKSLKESYVKVIADAQQQMKAGQAKLDAIEPARQEADKKRSLLDSAKEKLEEIKKGVRAIEDKISEALTLRQQAQRDADAACAELAPLLSIEVDLKNVDFKAFKTDVKGRAEAFAKNTESIASCEQKLGTLQTLIKSVTPIIDELARVLGAETKVPAKELDGLEEKLRTFNMNVTQLNGSIHILKTQLRAAEEASVAFFSTHNDMDKASVEAMLDFSTDDIENYRSEIRKMETKINQVEGAVKQIDSQIEELNKHKPELQEGETLEVLAAAKAEKEEIVEKLNKQKVEGETRLQDDAKRAKDQADDIREKERLQHLTNNWKVLNDAFGGKDGERFKRIAQSYVLRSLLQKANYYLRMLNTRYELACADGSLSISILDQAQGGAERNVSSLSGGEGFVVSLALALGLSAISKDKINVDTLFIDEGFGTLSGDYLETVINTLDKLHQLGGRRVGIISHVAELAHRIPAQIQLKRTGPSSSKIEICIL